MVHLRLEVVPAPGALAQPVSMSLSADKFQVLLAGEAGQRVGALLGLADLELASAPYHSSCTRLVPCRTEAGPDPDDGFGLRRVFPASVELPCLD